MSEIIKFFRGVYDFFGFWSQHHMFNKTKDYARKVFAKMSNKDQAKMYHAITRVFNYLKSIAQLAFGINYAFQAFAVLGAFSSWVFSTAVHLFAAFSFVALLSGAPSLMLSALVAPSLLYSVPVAAIALFGVYAFVITNVVDLFVSAAYATTLAIGSAVVAAYGVVAGLISHRNTSAPKVGPEVQENSAEAENLVENTLNAKPAAVNSELLSQSPTITHAANNGKIQSLLVIAAASENVQPVVDTTKVASNDNVNAAQRTFSM